MEIVKEMIQKKKLAIVTEEEILRSNFDPKKLHEEKVLHDLKRFGHKFIKWEWQTEDLPNTHLALIVTYEEMKYKIEEQYPDVYCKKHHTHTKDCMQ